MGKIEKHECKYCSGSGRDKRSPQKKCAHCGGRGMIVYEEASKDVAEQIRRQRGH
jgi:DnaJ-class molecular chaperone